MKLKNKILDIINISQNTLEEAIVEVKSKSHRSDYLKHKDSLPSINETFANFRNVLNLISDNEIYKPPFGSIFDLKEGIYLLGDKIMALSNMKEGMLNYMAFHSLATHQSSLHIKKLGGKYLTILKRIGNTELCEPISFSYFLRDEFFQERDSRYIFPLLILPNSIPDDICHEWVYLSLMYLNENISDEIEYEYLNF